MKQTESKQIVEAMKKNGIEYEYMLFPNEGHGLRKPENRLKFYAAAEEFLQNSWVDIMRKLQMHLISK